MSPFLTIPAASGMALYLYSNSGAHAPIGCGYLSRVSRDSCLAIMSPRSCRTRPSRLPANPQHNATSVHGVHAHQLPIDVTASYTSLPPGMTASKSSSRHSGFDDGLSDVSHFEDIGLDDTTTSDALHARDTQIKPPAPKPYAPGYPADLRAQQAQQTQQTQQRNGAVRQLTGSGGIGQKFRPQRDMTPGAGLSSRPEYPSLRNHIKTVNGRSVSMSASSDGPISPTSVPRLASGSTGSLPLPGRQRSPSPGFTLYPKDPNQLMRPRRSSWQSNRERRKSALELERECEDDEDDFIPDGLILENVPVSPRPTRDRPSSRPSSASPSPNRLPKDRRSVGNGTPPVAQAQGCLRSPTWKSDTALADAVTRAVGDPLQQQAGPLKGRAKSWNVAMAGLSPETKALTEKLEEHLDEQDAQVRRLSHDKRPQTWDSTRRSFDHALWEQRSKHKSDLPRLPPLQRNNAMIDPLPVSKEKEAVLSRTRPSWLPPKDPAEERRHLKEYQKMMALSAESDRRKEARRSASSAVRDSTADNLMRMWEEDILPRWNDAIRERRTRELWWKGVAPRSRGAVWAKAIGNELGLSETSYEAALKRAQDAEERVKEGKADADDGRREAWFRAIRRDVSDKTWPDLRIFQEGGPLHTNLVNVLSAYAMYRGDIGYVTGCNVR